MRAIEHLGPADMQLISCSVAETQIREAMAHQPPPPQMPPEAVAKMGRLMIASPTLGRVMANPEALSRTQKLLDTYNEGKCKALAQVFVTNNTWQVPTLIRLETMQQADDARFTQAPELEYIPRDVRGYWTGVAQQFTAKVTPEMRGTLKQLLAAELRMTKTFDEAGVSMLAGSDYGGIWVIPGVSLHQEFDLLDQAGLSPLRVLQMTTLDGARFLHHEATAGTVEEGKAANLVLLEKNPLERVANLHTVDAVVRGGRYYAKGDLEGLKKRVASHVAAEPAISHPHGNATP